MRTPLLIILFETTLIIFPLSAGSRETTKCSGFFEPLLSGEREACLKEKCPSVPPNLLLKKKPAAANQGISFEQHCELSCVQLSSQNIPGTRFVNTILHKPVGNGKPASLGSHVIIKFSGCALEKDQEKTIHDQTLVFKVGDISIGEGLTAAINGAKAGDRILLQTREEVAKGLRKHWPQLKAGSQIQLAIDIQSVN